MANHLEVANVFSIKRLHAQGWSLRRIARELGINRETVSRHTKALTKADEAAVESPASNPAKALTGSATEKEGEETAQEILLKAVCW